MISYFNLDAPLISTNFGQEFLDIEQDEEEEEKYQLLFGEEENEHLIKKEKIRNINEDREPIDLFLLKILLQKTGHHYLNLDHPFIFNFYLLAL